MNEWVIAMGKWYANVFNLNEKSYDLTIQPLINEGENVYSKLLDAEIGRVYNLGINLTCDLQTEENDETKSNNEIISNNKQKTNHIS